MASHIVVIGSGVVGLSTAIKVQELGYEVTILAECLPGDKTIKYTSPWAGAHHVSKAGPEDERQQWMDVETYKIMAEMAKGPAKECIMPITQFEYYAVHNPLNKNLSRMDNYRALEPSELKLGAVEGCTMSALTIEPAIYLPYLLSIFLGNGGKVQRVSLQHVTQAMSGAFAEKADAVIVCTGLGARLLGGVEDMDVYPIRGQTVLIKAPWINYGCTYDSPKGLKTYTIPRKSGDVILGGITVADDWYPKPRPETTKDIVERCLALCPELVPPEKHGKGKPTFEDLAPIIVEEGCGLRPGRKGGIRLEQDIIRGDDGRDVPVVYNYGHGGYGYESSWGSAIKAAQLLNKALSSN